MNPQKRGAPLETRETAIEEKKKKNNNSEEIETARASSSTSWPSSSRRKDITVSIDAILDISKFLNFENFRNFVKALWPNGDEDMLVRRRLWQLSTHKVTTMFMNMKTLEVEFNYDPERDEGDKWLVNLHSLSPVLGEIKLPLEDEFASLSELSDAVKDYVNLDSCENYHHTSCPCHLGENRRDLVRLSLAGCRYGYFHHFCSQHVVSWLDSFLIILMHDHVNGKIFTNEDNKFLLKILIENVYPQE